MGSSNQLNRVYKLQKKAIRNINRKPYNYHTEPIFKYCNILTIKDQYTFNAALFMHKIKYNMAPNSFQNLLYFTPPNRPVRQTRLNMANQTRARTKFLLHNDSITSLKYGMNYPPKYAVSPPSVYLRKKCEILFPKTLISHWKLKTF